MKPKVSPTTSRPYGQWIVLGIITGLLAVVFVQRQALYDWIRLRGYTAPTSIQKLAVDDTMTAYTRHLYYLNRPQLLDTVKTFRNFCPENKDTIVLGCYRPGENGIYVYDIKDPALAGVVQVTTAHEVLHAIYGRLGDRDKQQLNKLLQDYYDHGLTDERVKSEMDIYKKTEPTSLLDEMSSTFGTEIAKLPPALESYYAKYFSNRQKVVAYGARYQTEFTSRQVQIKTDDAKLVSLKQQISVERANLQVQGKTIDQKRSQLDDLLSANKTVEYNAQVPAFNAAVNSYNNSLTALQSDIGAYNDLVSTRNGIAGQLTTLASVLDTRLSSQTAK